MRININTKYLDKTLGFLMVYSPLRTTLGILIGIVFERITLILKEYFLIFNVIVENLHYWHYLVFGILTLNIKNLLFQSKKRNELPEKFENYFEAVRRMKNEGVLDETQIKKMYILGLNRVLKDEKNN